MHIHGDTPAEFTRSIPANAQHASEIRDALVPVQEPSPLLAWTAREVFLSEHINAHLLGKAGKLLREWYPGGYWEGHWYRQGPIQVWINLGDPICPVSWQSIDCWIRGNDLIGLYGHLEGLPYEIACVRLAKDLKISMPTLKQCAIKPGWRQLPVCHYLPIFVPPHPVMEVGYSFAGSRYIYHNPNGTFRGVLYEFSSKAGDSLRLSLSYCENIATSSSTWCWLGWGDDPLWYDQHLLWPHPRAVAIFPDEACVEEVKGWKSNIQGDTSPVPTTCSGGSIALPRADWSLLQGRTILVFVEDSAAGFEAVLEATDMARQAGVQYICAAAFTNSDLGRIFSSCDSAHRTQYAGPEIIVIHLKDFASIARERHAVAPRAIEALPSAQTFKVRTASEIASTDFYKKREYILEPIMPVKGLAMVYAPRGLGKSWVALTMAYAIATGRIAFDRWTAPRARIVLYLDGEMSMEMIQERLNAVAAGFGDPEPSSNLKLCCADDQDTPIPSLATSEGQDLIRSLLGGAEVLVVDNLATLATGASENSTEGWASLQNFFLDLRRKGHSVLIVHHSGKNGDQRGSSAREDVLDTSITLKRSEGHNSKDGVRAEVHLTKTRGFAGRDAEPFEIRLLCEDGVARWECRQDEDDRIRKIRPHLETEMSYRDIEEATGIPKSTVERLAKKIGMPPRR